MTNFKLLWTTFIHPFKMVWDSIFDNDEHKIDKRK